MKTLLIALYLVVSLYISSFGQDESIRSAVKNVTPKTYSKIAQNASKEWPTDFEMQKYVIEKQCKALREYMRIARMSQIPNKAFKVIENAALKEWCKNDWVECYKEFEKGDTDAYFSCLDANWEMLVYVINKQIEAYEALQ
jgi:hypothetical protein